MARSKYWRYRIVRTVFTNPDNGEDEVIYQIHQTWSRTSKGKVQGISEYGAAPIGCDPRGLKGDYTAMAEAFLYPILDAETLEDWIDARHPLLD